MTNNTAVELELTYLAKKIPAEIKKVKPTHLIDVYVPEDADSPHIRLRQRGEKYEITKKKPIYLNDFSRQTEQTIPLDKDEFEALAKSSNRRVIKDRYAVSIHNVDAEVDVFRGNLEGLVLIDFEFSNPAAQEAFRMPSYCLADVTQELFVAGGQLAGHSYSDIKADLKTFNYKKLSL